MRHERVKTDKKELLKIYQPEIIIKPSPDLVYKFSGTRYADQIYGKPDSNIDNATGSASGTYKEVVRLHKEKGLNLSRITGRNLDQYWKIPRTHELSYERETAQKLYDPTGVPTDQRFVPNSEAEDPEAEAKRYDDILTNLGPADLTLLGLGPDLTCHIAFNNPGTPIDTRTHVVEVDYETRVANSRFCDGVIDQVPKYAITQGIANILSARSILMVTTGAHKAEGVRKSLEGSIGPEAPATFLRYHPNVTWVIDEAAASLLGK
jgi:glucosamine-6-phosphate deaminase